jgi:hypothetical protein
MGYDYQKETNKGTNKMIRKLPEGRNHTLNVKLKSGQYFAGVDFPEGEASHVVAFFVDEKLRFYSIADIEYTELVPGE